MKRITRLMLLVSTGIAALTSACNFFAQPGDLQTENLQNEVAQTQIAAVRATATVNADRLMVTLENAQTAVGNVDLQSTRIAATLVAAGMTFVDASSITVAAPTAAPDSGGVNPQIANPLITPGVPQISSQGSAQGDRPLVQATPTHVSQQSADPNAPSLTNLTLTDTVGSDDCAIGSTNQFTTSTTDIYVVATANNVQPDTTLSATFSLEGQVIQTYPWTPGFEIDGACIWFHLPSDEVTFTPGNWSVTLTVNGASVGAPLAFTIESSTPTEIDITPQSGG
ncbi:MAG: hypothetical protein IT319_06560 [Anaerolineae bacterium]|nr:hypothetical protein [Anaerolineae bacterium]